MLKLLLAALPALLLTGCLGSTSSMHPSSPPPPPPAALQPCRPTPAHRQADGSATSADQEGTIRDGRFDLKACEDRRQLLLDAWPR